jgi:hypothetical protein
MPQTNPAGGLSLIIHIFINIVCYLYTKTLSVFGISNSNLVSKSFEWLNGETGETLTRKFLSYFILVTILGFFILNIAFISTRQYSLRIDDSNRIIGYIKNHLLGLTIDNKKPVVNENTATETKFENTNLGQMINVNSIETKINSTTDTYLVDFMIDLGIVDISFENRARIAKDLGVVNNLEEYIGTPKQNKEIIARLKSGIITVLKNTKQ